jgi:hypothetical protein
MAATSRSRATRADVRDSADAFARSERQCPAIGAETTTRSSSSRASTSAFVVEWTPPST